MMQMDYMTDGSGVNHREYGLVAVFAAATVDCQGLPRINVPTVWAKERGLEDRCFFAL